MLLKIFSGLYSLQTECNSSPIGKMSRKRRIALTKQNTSISGAAIESFKKQRGTRWVEVT